MLEKIRDERQLKALTGLSQEKFTALAAAFARVYEAEQQDAYARGARQRRPGAGQKGRLPNAEAKLLFVLYYFKNYPTFDVLGTHFAMARSKACENVHRLTPILHKTLANLKVMPERDFADVEAFKAALADANIEQLLVDVTERLCQRPGDYNKQREHYSGKKSAIR